MSLTVAAVLVALEGGLWMLTAWGMRQFFRSCFRLTTEPCWKFPQVSDGAFAAAAIPGLLLIALCVVLWQRRHWAWLAAVAVQVVLVLIVAVLLVSPFLGQVDANGRSPGQFAADLAVAFVLLLLELVVAALPVLLVLLLLLVPSSRRSLR